MGKKFASVEEKKAYWQAVNRRHYLKQSKTTKSFSIRMPNDLYNRLHEAAGAKSLNWFLINFLKHGLDRLDSERASKDTRGLSVKCGNLTNAQKGSL